MKLGAVASLAVFAAASLAIFAQPAAAQNYPITTGQKATAEQVAQTGVPLSELSPTAPDSYTVKAGDTLWAISGMFLKSPWRWPELWGMNMQEVHNPHLIFPGQTLYLDKSDGRARLRMGGMAAGGGAPTDTVRVSPATRYETLAETALPTLRSNLIEPFLSEPIVVDEKALLAAPRIVAAQENRVLLSKGDRAYARSDVGTPMLVGDGRPRAWRVFREVTPLKDPDTKEILGYEAQYVGKVDLVRGESERTVMVDGKTTVNPVPATIDVVAAKEEIRAGDRLVPEPPRQLLSYTPRAPQGPVNGAVVSVYGSAVSLVAQNQIIVINKGTRDGLEAGHVLALLRNGATITDRDATGKKTVITLPNERNGLVMVFRPFERVSYALVLEIADGVEVGDRITNPR